MARRYATPPGLSSRRAEKSCTIAGTGGDMSLRFGVFDHIEPVPGQRLDQIYRERLVQIARLDRAGFYAYHLAEHPTPAHHRIAPQQYEFHGHLAKRQPL